MVKTFHRSRKRFGQNFLQDQNVIRRIMEAVSPSVNQNIVEIGPGRGALTGPILNEAKNLTAIELDRDLIAYLQQKFANCETFNLLQGDALVFDFRQLGQDKPLRAIGNLPYNITTPLLFHLLEQIDAIVDMHFMVQKEVAARLCASPGTKDYGRLSVMVQYYCRVESLFDVAPNSFTPAPKVDSSFIRLIPEKPITHPVNDKEVFAKLVKRSFQHRRKTIYNNLRTVFTAEALQEAGINPSARAETLTVADYVRLSNKTAQEPIISG